MLEKFAKKAKIIFRLLKKILNNINNYDKKNVLLLYVFFQLQCLIYLGYCPAIKKCDQCFISLEEGWFNYSSGQLSCKNCINDKKKGFNKKQLNMINYLMITHIDKAIINLNYEEDDLKIINNFLYKYILFHVPDIKNSKAFTALSNEN